ncbi:MAG: ATP-dependent DNA helicase RecG, partial [Bacilli bacterium]
MNLAEKSVLEIKGVGEEYARYLEEMNIFSVMDCFEHTPYRYEHFEEKDLSLATHEEQVTIRGEVTAPPLNTTFKKGKSRTTFTLYAHPVAVKAVCFNQPYLKQKIKVGDTITVAGKWDKYRQSVSV